MARPKGSKNNHNGNGHASVVENTADVNDVVITETEKVEPKKKPLTPHSWENAYKMQEAPNSLKPLFEAGDNPLDLLMRSIIGNAGTDEYRLMIALHEENTKAREVGDLDGQIEVSHILAMLPSLQGEARKQYVSAIIGQFFNSDEIQREGFSSRLKKMAFGDKEK